MNMKGPHLYSSQIIASAKTAETVETIFCEQRENIFKIFFFFGCFCFVLFPLLLDWFCFPPLLVADVCFFFAFCLTVRNLFPSAYYWNLLDAFCQNTFYPFSFSFETIILSTKNHPHKRSSDWNKTHRVKLFLDYVRKKQINNTLKENVFAPFMNWWVCRCFQPYRRRIRK